MRRVNEGDDGRAVKGRSGAGGGGLIPPQNSVSRSKRREREGRKRPSAFATAFYSETGWREEAGGGGIS